jgi:hypothetical protein
MNEIDKLKRLAEDTSVTNKLVQRIERVIDQENASSQQAVEAASFIVANALSRFPDPMGAWDYVAQRIEKAIKEGFDPQ